MLVPAFDFDFAFAGRRRCLGRLAPDESHGSMTARIGRAFAEIVLGDSVDNVRRNAGIQATVVTTENINVPAFHIIEAVDSKR